MENSVCCQNISIIILYNSVIGLEHHATHLKPVHIRKKCSIDNISIKDWSKVVIVSTKWTRKLPIFHIGQRSEVCGSKVLNQKEPGY